MIQISRNKVRPEQPASFEFVETEEERFHWSAYQLNSASKRLSVTRPSNNFTSTSPLFKKTAIIFRQRDTTQEDDESVEVDLFRTSTLPSDEFENQTINELEGMKHTVMMSPKRANKNLAAYSADYKFEMLTFACCKA